MKIAVIVKEFPTLSETFILNQITGLIDLGHEIEIFSRMKPTTEKLHSDIISYELLDRTYYPDVIPGNKLIRVLRAFKLLVRNLHKSPWMLLSSLNVLKYGKESLSLNMFYAVIPFAGKRYDIIKCHFGPNGNFGAMLKKMNIGLKLVTMFHGHDIRKGLQEGGNIYRPLFDVGDCFLANSDYSYENLISFGVDPQKVILHPGGIYLHRFPYREKGTESASSEPIMILTVARLVHEKGLEYGIQAVKKLLEKNPKLCLRYHIVGAGPLEKQLKNLVHELKLKEIVYLLGGMLQEDVIREMQNAHIFVLPSVEEALGVVLMEAQAIGLPVVATSTGSVDKVIKDGESGYIVPVKNADALADKLMYLIEHQEIWPQMGRAGRKFIEENYNIKILNKQLEDIYQKLLTQ